MNTLRVFVAIAIVVLISSAVFAQAVSLTQNLLDEIAAKSDSVVSYTADVRIDMTMMGQPKIIEGTVSFKQPDKMYVKTVTNQMGGTEREVFSSNGVVYTYMPVMKTATRMDMRRLEAAGHENSDMTAAIDISKPFESFSAEGIRYLGTEETNGGAIQVFDARPLPTDEIPHNMPTPQMFGDTMVFRIQTETGLPSKISILSADGSVMIEHTYSNIKVNVPIDDSEFVFTPPADVQVVDMTEGALSMMSQMQ